MAWCRAPAAMDYITAAAAMVADTKARGVEIDIGLEKYQPPTGYGPPPMTTFKAASH